MTPEQIVDIIIKYVIPAVATIVTGFLIPLIKNKIGETKWNIALKWGQTVVKAAEQMFEPGTGVSKKEYVTQQISAKFKWLKPQQIDLLIEACAYEVSKGMDSSKGGKFTPQDYVASKSTTQDTADSTIKKAHTQHSHDKSKTTKGSKNVKLS